MAEVGDRVIVESEKVGTPPRSGTVIGVEGSLVRVRWEDGSETSMIPQAGALQVVGKESEAASR